MTRPPRIARPLGTMIAYGFPRGAVGVDLELATRMGASLVEVLPDWPALPDPIALRRRVADNGLAVHSAHGCWGGRSIAARRVDLGSLDPATRRESVDDIRRCVDWLAEAGGACLVVHPGGLSDPADAPARRVALADSLQELAGPAEAVGIVLCVENMPPGVHPGSRMADLSALVTELDLASVGLALDTGHAHLGLSTAAETRAAGRLLRTTHVHDNHGRQDLHLLPGLGTIDWPDWVAALDEVEYAGPLILECIRHIRDDPDCLTPGSLALLSALSGNSEPPPAE